MSFRRFNSENGKYRSRPRSAAIFIERSIREITRTTLRFTLIERPVCLQTLVLFAPACFENDYENENDCKSLLYGRVALTSAPSFTPD